MSSDHGGNDNEESDPSNVRRTVEFKLLYWKYEDTDDGALQIHIGGKTKDKEKVHCIVTGFTPFVYLELPKRIKWNKAKCKILVEHFQKVMKSSGPLQYWLLQKYKLKYKKLCNTIRLTFPTDKAVKDFTRKCHGKQNIVVDGLGALRAGELVVHESNVDPIIKFTASKGIKLASWVRAVENIRPEDRGSSEEDRKYSSADIDLYAEWTDVDPFVPPETVIVRPEYICFDIECYSKNHNSKLPDPTIPENFIVSIGNRAGSFGGPIDEKVLFTLFNPHDIPGTRVVRCANEKEMLLKWKAYVQTKNPDILMTYNGMKFDWNYMIERAELIEIWNKFAQISRIFGKKADLMTSSWSSSAYGEQKFKYLDPMGRVNVDVLLEIERNFKLPQYGLGAVGKFFKVGDKDDITPRQLFMLVQLTMELTEEIESLPDGLLPKEQRIKIKKDVQRILQMRRCSGEVRKLRDQLMAAKKGSEFKYLIRMGITLIGKYNIQDCDLTTAIAEKLNLWTVMEETSNCMNIPTSYLHTRGQQIKVLAQVYRDTIFNDFIIPFRPKVNDGEAERYQGAVVIEANPGDYDNVVCFDFESLYPSVMIAFNICWTTLLEDDDPTPDEECHVLAWGDHVGCLAKGTNISTINRSFPIQNLEKYRGELYGHDIKKFGELGRYRQTNFFNQGIKECIKLTFEDGTTLECTPDHRILTSECEWVEAQDLIEGESRVKASHAPPAMIDLKLLRRENIGLRETYDLEVEESHSFVANGIVVHNCEHDPKKRKKKAADVLCKEHRYRFKKVVFHPDGTKENEGLMPKLVRKLLVERKAIKKEMAKLDAKLKMVLGLAEPDDIAFYKKMNWDIVEKGSMTSDQIEVLKVGIAVLNAQQNAMKISANSVAEDTPVPCMSDGKFCYLPIDKLAKEGTWKVDEDGNELAESIDNLQVWSDVGFTDVKYVFRHPKIDNVKRVLTHVGCVDVTEDHSLLNIKGKEVSTKDIQIGDELLHKSSPLPKDTPKEPLYRAINDMTIKSYKLGKNVSIDPQTGEFVSEKLAFAWGAFFAEGNIWNMG